MLECSYDCGTRDYCVWIVYFAVPWRMVRHLLCLRHCRREGYAITGGALLEEDTLIDGDMLLEGERTNR